jgi:2-polyprenyl-6-methoxyphenol hydroxylase-like FAD-dependent oxidoreductase
MDEVVIVGAGIGGLTLALTLHQAGIPCRVYESAPEIRPIGVGINVLPHAAKELAGLGLRDVLVSNGIATAESAFFNRFGQLIYREPAGVAAGYDWPQVSIHRGALQLLLLDAVRERLGADSVRTGYQCVGVEQTDDVAVALFAGREPVRGRAVIACDGIHSAVRKQFYPNEGAPLYSGYNMWRGVTVWPRFLTGATMVRAGWLATGKMVIYPIRDLGDGKQLINWVAEIETPNHLDRDWNRSGRLEDFLPAFADWHFDWLDVPALIQGADTVLEFPMVDQDPLPRWTFGRVTLLGDAAHPMVPRGSNGAGQAVLDARALADCLAGSADVAAALTRYEQGRLPPTTQVVLTNRRNPPDAILREVYERTGDKPFARIEDVIPENELRAITDRYKTVAGYDRTALAEART